MKKTHKDERYVEKRIQIIHDPELFAHVLAVVALTRYDLDIVEQCFVYGIEYVISSKHDDPIDIGRDQAWIQGVTDSWALYSKIRREIIL